MNITIFQSTQGLQSGHAQAQGKISTNVMVLWVPKHHYLEDERALDPEMPC